MVTRAAAAFPLVDSAADLFLVNSVSVSFQIYCSLLIFWTQLMKHVFIKQRCGVKCGEVHLLGFCSFYGNYLDKP